MTTQGRPPLNLDMPPPLRFLTARPQLGMTPNMGIEYPQVTQTLGNSESGPAGNLGNTEVRGTASKQGTQPRWQVSWACGGKDKVSRVREQAWESGTSRLLVCAWGLLGNGLELQAKVSGCGQGKQNEH